jgi:hypothetical protein
MPSATDDFAGQINGNINFVKSGLSQLNLHDNNQFTGSTLVLGNVLSLVDQGRLSNTSGITVDDSVLQWNDTGIQALTNRLPSNVPITRDGGAIQFISRSGLNETYSIGSLALNQGATVVRIDIGVNAGGTYPTATGIGSATLDIGGAFSRSTGSTLTFIAGSGDFGDNPNVFLSSALFLTNGVLNSANNGIIGGWATAYSGEDTVTGGANVEFATYDPASGVRALTGAMQYASFNAASGITGANVRLGGNANVLAGGQTINSLTMNNAVITVGFVNATDVLTLTSGGILSGTDANARTIGSAAIRGIITTTGPELFLNQGDNTLTINSQIGSAGNSSFAVVMSGISFSLGQQILLTDANIYTGATYVSSVITELDNLTGSGFALGTGTSVILTGSNNESTDSLAVADTAVRLFASSQINPAATLTIRSEAELDLNGYTQSLAKLAFNSLGGSNGGNGPTILTGSGVLTLTATSGTITASNLLDLRTIPSVFGNLILPSTAEITAAANADGSVTAAPAPPV